MVRTFGRSAGCPPSGYRPSPPSRNPRSSLLPDWKPTRYSSSGRGGSGRAQRRNAWPSVMPIMRRVASAGSSFLRMRTNSRRFRPSTNSIDHEVVLAIGDHFVDGDDVGVRQRTADPSLLEELVGLGGMVGIPIAQHLSAPRPAPSSDGRPETPSQRCRFPPGRVLCSRRRRSPCDRPESGARPDSSSDTLGGQASGENRSAKHSACRTTPKPPAIAVRPRGPGRVRAERSGRRSEVPYQDVYNVDDAKETRAAP